MFQQEKRQPPQPQQLVFPHIHASNPIIPRSLLSTSTLRPQPPREDRRNNTNPAWGNAYPSDQDLRQNVSSASSSSRYISRYTASTVVSATAEGPAAKRVKIDDIHRSSYHPTPSSSSSSSQLPTPTTPINTNKRRFDDDSSRDPKHDRSPKQHAPAHGSSSSTLSHAHPHRLPSPPPTRGAASSSYPRHDRDHNHSRQYAAGHHRMHTSSSASYHHHPHHRDRDRDRDHELERDRDRRRSRSRTSSKSPRPTPSESSESSSESESEDDIMVATENVLMNPLRTQGEIHDLLISLERARTRYIRATDKVKAASRTIQHTCHRLERKVRILADGILSTGTATPLTSPTATKPDFLSISNAAASDDPRSARHMAAPAPALAPAPATVSATTTNTPQTSKRSAPLPPQGKILSNTTASSASSSLPITKIDSGIGPSKTDLGIGPSAPRSARKDSNSSTISSSSDSCHMSVSPPTIGTNVLRRARQSISAPVSIPIARLDTCDVIFQPIKDLKNKAFSRKPRSLIFNIVKEDGDPAMKDLMVTSSLDGDIQFWESNSRCILSSVGKSRLNMPWPEDICWVTESTLAVGAARKEGERETRQVGLVHIEGVDRAKVSWRIQHLNPCPHDKGLSVIAPVKDGVPDSNGGQRMSFVTGGADKTVTYWELSRSSTVEDFRLLSATPLPIKHTSVVHALCYDRHRDVLYSGGADFRFFAWDMGKERFEREGRYSERINHILQNPADPKLLLFSLSSKLNQLNLYDTREPNQGFALQFGFNQTENVSRYISPCWHGNGYLVSCGSMSDGKIHFWDIRYTGVTRGPAQSMEAHDRRVLKAMFLPGRDTIVSMSSNSSILFTDYSLKTDSIVQSHGS